MKAIDRVETRQQPTIGAFVQGLLAAVALASLTSTGGSTVSGVIPLAVGMGIAAGVFAVAGQWLAHIAGWFYSALGVVAFIPTAIDFVRSNGCLAGPPPAVRFAVVALLVLIALSMFAASVLTVRGLPASVAGLALFGALQVVIAAGTFISGPGDSGNWLATALLIPAAAVLGWTVVYWPDAVLGVAGAATAMQSIYASAVDSACAEANYSGSVLIIGFIGAYFATRAVSAPFAGRR